MALDVIGAGFGRTGTLSMRAALEELGFDPCYHFTEVIERRPGRNDGHRKAWVDFAKGRRAMDWRWLFRDYRATVDFPMCLYQAELRAAYPEARVVLTVRDPERWFESFDTLAQSLKRLRFGSLFAPKLRATTTIFDRLLRDGIFGGRLARASCIAAFERHRDTVVRDVPADRLLVYEVGEGWGPLCRFLDVPVPATPFPHLNEGEALDERMTRALLLGEKDVFTVERTGGRGSEARREVPRRDESAALLAKEAIREALYAELDAWRRRDWSGMRAGFASGATIEGVLFGDGSDARGARPVDDELTRLADAMSAHVASSLVASNCRIELSADGASARLSALILAAHEPCVAGPERTRLEALRFEDEWIDEPIGARDRVWKVASRRIEPVWQAWLEPRRDDRAGDHRHAVEWTR